MRGARSQKGFTLIELMIAMALTTILVAMAMQISVIVLTGYRHHREAVAVQRSARATLDLVSDAVRNGSAGVPSGAIIDAAGCTDTDAIEIVNHTNAPDELYVMAATGGIVTSLRDDYEEDDSSATVLDANGLSAGELVLVTDFDQGYIVRVASAPTDNGSDWTVPLEATTCSGVDFHFTRGAMMLRVRVSRFYVDDVDGVPTMFLDPDADGPDEAEPLAEGVEDFQVAAGIDENNDGSVTDNGDDSDEWYYNDASDSTPPVIAVKPWRALRLTMVARTTLEQENADWSTRPTVEDHGGATAPDGYRRRTVSTIVEIRNLEGSP